MSDHEEETINEENAHPKVVPQITTVTNISAKFPYLKKGDAKSMTTDKDGNLKIRPPVIAEEHQQVQREEKARTILLSALPDEHIVKEIFGRPTSFAGRPVSAGNPTGSAGRPVSAGNPTGSVGRPISIGNPTGSDGRPVSAGRPSGSAARTPIPAGHILGKLPSNTLFERFSRASGVENSDIHDGLKIFDCPKSVLPSPRGSIIFILLLKYLVISTLLYKLEVKSNIKVHLIVLSSPIFMIRGGIIILISNFVCFLLFVSRRATTVAQALVDPDWVEAIQAEMQQFRNQKVWVLVTLPDGKQAIGTKWILKNKWDAKGIVCRNKARLVAQGHRHEEGIDYTDVFAPVARIKAIRLFLAFASFIGFMVYQMDVKSAFLYGKIAEEVYVTQPSGFEDVKALYGLHQAPRSWYERLSTFLLKHGYKRGTIDMTLFIKKDSKYIMLV
uniref:Putative ribonuclease H-like domain-containing protein n=1 Tax=Tanacetum cinerariifolium TaxID=118510 RepID=A0A699J6N5_TANCI|nr:putative ribonuclease H-like domain-containing protein [Tanacetum cinerariifolium]